MKNYNCETVEGLKNSLYEFSKECEKSLKCGDCDWCPLENIGCIKNNKANEILSETVIDIIQEWIDMNLIIEDEDHIIH